MKFKLTVLFALLIFAVAASVNAGVYKMDFTNATLDLGPATQIDLTNQYSGFGLTFDHAYRYIDGRDPWDDMQFGVSNGWVSEGLTPATAGTVFFSELTNFVSFQWWTLSPSGFYADAFDASGAWVGGGFYGAGPGENTIFGVGIQSLVWHDNGGQTGISTLTYETSLVPEPATMLLVGLGLAGAGLVSRKRRKK